MQIPPASHPVWTGLVTGQLAHPLNFLAAKIMLGRLLRTTAQDSSPQTILQCAMQIREIYETHLGLPSVDQDLKTLFL